ncbi:uncharacterized protein LOC125748407 isoform X2 [Brienomyrus brachyistius]|nr:uncharacterized protein LOC125748407 isoform X2 [Brienomyrus brachyistius]
MERIEPPSPSCLSMKSDHSMDLPMKFKDGNFPPDIRRTMERIEPRPPSCLSMKSDHSMDLPMKFKDGNFPPDIRCKMDRIILPAPSYLSMKTDHSMAQPIGFNSGSIPSDTRHTMERIDPPSLSCLSMKSDLSMDLPMKFKDGNLLPDISELPSSLLTEDQFRCSVCSDLLKDPVSIPCGHSYCRQCITTYWEKPGSIGSYACPQCKKRSRTYPVLYANSALAVLLQKLQQAGLSPTLPGRSYAEPGDVACDWCIGRKLKAVKSCLTCTASYCETHVKPHYIVPALERHRLEEATENLEHKLCQIHHRALEFLCKMEKTLICSLCLVEQHQGHDVVFVKSEDSVKLSYKDSSVLTFQTKFFSGGREEPKQVFIIDLSERKASLLLEVLKLQTDRRAVELEGWSEEESEVRSFLQCLPYISQLRFSGKNVYSSNKSQASVKFLLKLSVEAAESDTGTGGSVSQCLSSVCSYSTFPCGDDRPSVQCGFLLYLYSHVKDYESQTQRSVLPTLLPIYQSAPAVWVIDLSVRKASLLLEVLKLQTDKRPVELEDWSEEESEMRSFLQCLPYISQLRFSSNILWNSNKHQAAVKFLLKLSVEAAESDTGPGGSVSQCLSSVCSYITFPCDNDSPSVQCGFLLYLYSHVKDYESQTQRSVLPTLLPIYQSAPAVWVIYLSVRKASRLLEVLKLQTDKRAVELKGWSEEEGEVRSFLQCLPYISQLRFSDECFGVVFVLKMCSLAADHAKMTGETPLETLFSVFNIKTIIKGAYENHIYNVNKHNLVCGFLLDLYSHVKDYESQTQRSVLPTLLPIDQSAPAVWVIDLSVRKASLLLEVLKLQTDRRPVELEGWSEEESEVRSFLQCLPYVSQLRFDKEHFDEDPASWTSFVLKMCSLAADHAKQTGETPLESLFSVFNIKEFVEALEGLFNDMTGRKLQEDFLLDLCSHVKDYESQTQRSVLPTLLPFDQSAPAVWVIDLSVRKASLLLEVLKLQTDKRAVELKGWSEEESEVRSFLQCLPYVSQLRFDKEHFDEDPASCTSFVLKMCSLAADHAKQTGETPLESLFSVFNIKEFVEALEGLFNDMTGRKLQEDFLLDLCSHVKDYESQTQRSVLPTLLPFDQSAPAVWVIDLSVRKASLLLEVLKLQTDKRPVELKGWSEEESEVRSFLQCLPYISQLRFSYSGMYSVTTQHHAAKFLLKLSVEAAESDTGTGRSVSQCLSSACSYSTFPCDDDRPSVQCVFLLDLYSHVKDYESQTQTSVLPTLLPIYQSAPAVWVIDLSVRKASLLLEVLKLQRDKRPVELKGWTEEESEMRSFLQCLPYISQLRYSTECPKDPASIMLRMCSVGVDYMKYRGGTLLLDLYSHVKDYESQTQRSVLPTLLPIYQSAPAVWVIDLSVRKASLLLEVLKLQTDKRAVELEGWSEEESEVRSFLQCLPYISQLRFDKEHFDEDPASCTSFVLKMCSLAADHAKQTGETPLESLFSVFNIKEFVEALEGLFNDMTGRKLQEYFLLDLYSHVKDYESQTQRSVLPTLLPIYQSAPAVWVIDLSERKASLLLEVLKLQTDKRAVELEGWSEEESEMRSFLQCLPYISQLRFSSNILWNSNKRQAAVKFLLKLSSEAAESDTGTGGSVSQCLSSVCSYITFHCDDDRPSEQCGFLLYLYSCAKDYESQTQRSVLPTLLPIYQSAPAVWVIDLSVRKASLLLEVLKLQTDKRAVELEGWSEEESEVRSFLQCLPYISQLRFDKEHFDEDPASLTSFVLKMCSLAADHAKQSGETTLESLFSVFNIKEFVEALEGLFNDMTGRKLQEDFLLDLYSHVKDYESQSQRSVLPTLLPFDQSAPAVWVIDLSVRKASLLLEVLKLQTDKRAVELKGWSEEESEVRSFLQCLPYISQLRFSSNIVQNSNKRQAAVKFLVKLSAEAAESDTGTGGSVSQCLSSVCSYITFPCDDDRPSVQCGFLLDLYSHVKDYESQTQRSVLPTLLPIYQSAPAVCIIDLSVRKASLLLEVLKLQTDKRAVELEGWSEEESEVRSFLQCLPYISQLRFDKEHFDEDPASLTSFVLKMCSLAADHAKQTGETPLESLFSVFNIKEFVEALEGLFNDMTGRKLQEDFLLDLYSHVKDYESQSQRSVLPTLLPIYQSAPAVWVIDLSERKASLLLEVLKLQTDKRAVELKGWSEEESEVRSFLQCLPYISQLRFSSNILWNSNKRQAAVKFLLKLRAEAAESDTGTGGSFSQCLSSVCSYITFLCDDDRLFCEFYFLLDLFSHVKDYESQTQRTVLPTLLPIYQSAPAVWVIDLSVRKASRLLEVLKLQTDKRAVELKGWSEEEGEVRSFLQCLPYISQLRFSRNILRNSNKRQAAVKFLLKLSPEAAESDTGTGGSVSQCLSSVCSYSTFPCDDDSPSVQCKFLLDLYSHVKDYESQTQRCVLPTLLPIYQSAPAVWVIDLSERKASLLLEVLKLQRDKRPVELKGWSEEESEVRSFLQCLPYISQLRFSSNILWDSKKHQAAVKFLLKLSAEAAESDTGTGGSVSQCLSSVCSYSSFPCGDGSPSVQCKFLLDLYSHVKDYESQTQRSVLPTLLPIYQSAPAVWIIDLSVRKASLLLEVLKLQTDKRAVELEGLSEEESEVRSFLQCLPYISQLRLVGNTLEKWILLVYKVQDNQLTQSLLETVGGDLSTCSLDWEVLQYLLQNSDCHVTMDLKKSRALEDKTRDLLLFLDRVELKRPSPRFTMSALREAFEVHSVHSVSSLVKAVGGWINLNSRVMDNKDCAALQFTLRNCKSVKLSLLWSSLPEGALESIVSLLHRVSKLSVDRNLMLRFLHFCTTAEDQQGATTALLQALQHKLDFSSSSVVDLSGQEGGNDMCLSAGDCRVIFSVVQLAQVTTDLVLQDCEASDAALEHLFPVLHKVCLRPSKPLLLQLLHLTGGLHEAEAARRAKSLCSALGQELDLSHTPVDLEACRALALVLEQSEGLPELDLSHCHLTDACLELLLPHLHKVQVLDLSHNDITDHGAQGLQQAVCSNSSVQTVRLFSNKITDRRSFKTDNRFEIW